MDEFTRLVLAEFQRAVQAGEDYTRPWLDLDVEAYRACREGRGPLPEPWCDDLPNALVLSGAAGLDVLCLAGGGGQQSALFSLLGARVTVLDLTPEQLEADQAAAAHYGYAVTTIQGDMRDLSCLPSGAFDRVYQPISTLYVQDLRPVYTGVQRMLRPGGLYYSDYTYPLVYMAQTLGWDGSAYQLRVGEPYTRGEIRETPEGRVSFTEGSPIGEYHHLLSDIVNGLIEAGLAIRGVWENPRPEARGGKVPGISANMVGGANKVGGVKKVGVDVPGMPAHRDRYLPYGLTVLAER